MIIIGQTIVSEELLEKRFQCDVKKCKGICCVEGDAGAPLEASEIPQMEDALEAVKPYMEAKGLEVVEEEGVWNKDSQGELVTPLVEGRECAFAVFRNGIALCAFEQAYEDGKTAFKKPISCHLYPIRVQKGGTYEQLHYHRWEICKSAVKCGIKKDVPVFRFLKDALVRKYGEDWYEQLEWLSGQPSL